MKENIGVYICHCGGNISDYVDVAKVESLIEQEEGVQLVRTMMFTCSDSAQVDIVNDIKENNLDGMVVASCSPKLHLMTFRDVAKRAGLNQYNYIHANIREQCSWAHSDKTELATDKAVRIIRAAISRVKSSETLEQIEIPAVNTAVVVGAGVSGMRSAIDMADQGTNVYLIEKDHFVGGRVSQWGSLFPTEEQGESLVERLYHKMEERENITLFTGAEIEEVKGSIGNFEVQVKVNPRYTVGKCSEDFFIQAQKACHKEVDDPFNFGMTKRKAIYKNYKSAFPDSPAIDMEACDKCGECAKICNGNIDLKQEEENITIKAGAVLLNTGFQPYEPKEGEYGYKQLDNVITLPEFIRLTELSNGSLKYNGKEIRNIAYIYCVGSRDAKGENKHCSRYCCTSAIHSAINASKKFRDVKNYHVTRGIRTYGKQEVLFSESSRQGDVYLQFFEENMPVVEQENGETLVKVTDALTQNEAIEVGADLVVLVTGMVARPNEKLENIFKVPIGGDKFYNEVHNKLRPVETVIDGLYIAGGCQGPKNIRATMASTLAASAKANTLINSGTIALEPIIAKVDPELCEWCDICDDLCSYNAFQKVEYNGKMVAEVNEALCKGCGACTAVCPQNAINIVSLGDKDIEAMIDAFIQDVEFPATADVKAEDAAEEVDLKDAARTLPELSQQILQALNTDAKAIPDIARELNVASDLVLYHLMSLRKYGMVRDTDEINEDEYYLYELKK